MKLRDSVVEKLITAINTANAIGIDSLVIDAHSVRGTTPNGILLIEKDYMDVDGFDAIGVGSGRVSTLNSRLNLVNNSTLPTVDIDVRTKESGEKSALRLVLKSNKTSVEFKCFDPDRIKAHKNLKSDKIYSFTLTKESLGLLTKGKATMGIDKILFILEDGKVFFKVNDIEGDSLKHEITDKVKIEDDSDTFLFKYNEKALLPLLKLAFKEDDEIELNFTKRGTINLNINNFNVYIAQDI